MQALRRLAPFVERALEMARARRRLGTPTRLAFNPVAAIR